MKFGEKCHIKMSMFRILKEKKDIFKKMFDLEQF